MTARDIDATIHRQVFGKVVRTDRHGMHWTDEVGLLGLDAVPKYSEDVAAAWSVVEQMGRLGWNCRIEWKGAGRGYEHTAEVSFARVKTMSLSGHGVGSFPWSVCSAALMGLEFNSEE